MSSEIAEMNLLKGAHFIVSDDSKENVFTPEDLTEEQIMVSQTVKEFIRQDFRPLANKLEEGEHQHNVTLLKKLAELGILGAHMPEEYGGMNLDTNTNTLINEELGCSGSFGTTFGAHTGIGMLPILYYGTESQKQKYLPELITAKKIACYCLTEPSSGSDALAAKTRADLSEDGKHYIFNGQKMWISNAGFADIFIVFAKIDGIDFTAFILEKGMEGLTLGAEEKKMGIKGSSTRQVFFENVKVPVENLLGNQGEGHVIAFNVLNTGRYKIGPFTSGACKSLLETSAQYANERNQFGKPIASFGVIQSKIADQAILSYVLESSVYRTSNLIQDYIDQLKSKGIDASSAKLEAAEEYALESSILKVGGTDIVNRIADETVQIHGGMGYSEETIAARAYRDARICKIYEGTNEINRMLMIDLIFKRAMKGKLDFTGPALQVQQELLTGASNSTQEQTPEAKAVKNFKKIALMLIGSVGQVAMKGKINLKTEQELMLALAEILIQTYLAESALLRSQKYPSEMKENLTKGFISEASNIIRNKGLEAIGIFVKPQRQEPLIQGLNHYLSYPLINSRDIKRSIAERILKGETYVTN